MRTFLRWLCVVAIFVAGMIAVTRALGLAYDCIPGDPEYGCLPARKLKAEIFWTLAVPLILSFAFPLFFHLGKPPGPRVEIVEPDRSPSAQKAPDK